TLASGGNYAAALLVYRELRLLLHREMHAAPDAATTALFQQLRAEARSKAATGRRGDPALRAWGDGAEEQDRLARPAAPSPRRAFRRDGHLSLHRYRRQHAAVGRASGGDARGPHPHEALLRQAIDTYGGHVFKTMGDQVCAAFATAPDALAAALA